MYYEIFLVVYQVPFSCLLRCKSHAAIMFMSLFLQGNLYEFLKLTGWRGSKVLYFGDHIYSDLAVSSLLSQNQRKDEAFC